jgi:hypothetical protein
MPNPTHAEFVQGLRELAQFYEDHLEVKLPQYSSHFSVFANEYLYGSKEEAKETVIAAAKAFGHSEKIYSQESFQLVKEFTGGIKLTVLTDRKVVCTPVVVGKKTIPGRVEPAVAERYIPEATVDEIEWKCESILAPTRDQTFGEIIVEGENPPSTFEESEEKAAEEGEI